MQQNRLVLGKIAGVYGVRGWVKIFSHTSPKENIFNYTPWQVNIAGQLRELVVLEGRPQGKGLVAHIESFDDREKVRELIGAEISVLREQLPEAGKDEYYWADMEGLEVVTLEGLSLGKVDHLFETGANDVIVVKGERERLIPFVQGQYIHEIDLENGVIRVDWDPEF